jgi:hypothetical protein
MFATAREELTHIPNGDYVQGVLRASYWTMRLNSLGRKAEFPDDPAKLIDRAVADVLRLEPTALPEYDRGYFAKSVVPSPSTESEQQSREDPDVTKGKR